MTALDSSWRWLPRAIALGLLAYAIFGPLANLAAVGLRRGVVLARQAALALGLPLLGATCSSPPGSAMEALWNSAVDRRR